MRVTGPPKSDAYKYYASFDWGLPEKFPWWQRWLKAIWPRERSVIGRTIKSGYGAVTIGNGEIYSIFHQRK